MAKYNLNKQSPNEDESEVGKKSLQQSVSEDKSQPTNLLRTIRHIVGKSFIPFMTFLAGSVTGIVATFLVPLISKPEILKYMKEKDITIWELYISVFTHSNSYEDRETDNYIEILRTVVDPKTLEVEFVDKSSICRDFLHEGDVLLPDSKFQEQGVTILDALKNQIEKTWWHQGEIRIAIDRDRNGRAEVRKEEPFYTSPSGLRTLIIPSDMDDYTDKDLVLKKYPRSSCMLENYTPDQH